MYFFVPKTYYQPNYEKVRNQVKASDILFTDGTHRIAGIKILQGLKHTAEVTYIGMRVEVAYAKQIAFENGIKVVSDKDFSLKLVRDYIVGDTVFYFKDKCEKINKNQPYELQIEGKIKKCDVIITDDNFFAVGLQYDSKKMEAPSIIFLSDDVKCVKEIATHCKISLCYNRPLARAVFTDHNPGEVLQKIYYNCVAEIYSNIYKQSNKEM